MRIATTVIAAASLGALASTAIAEGHAADVMQAPAVSQDTVAGPSPTVNSTYIVLGILAALLIAAAIADDDHNDDEELM